MSDVCRECGGDWKIKANVGSIMEIYYCDNPVCINAVNAADAEKWNTRIRRWPEPPKAEDEEGGG
jgi:hypothetical protein